MMNFTTPTEVGPLGVLLFFTTFYVIMFGVSSFLVSIFLKIKGKKMKGKGYTYAGVVAFAPVILLLLRSFVGFSVYSVLVAIMFVGLGCFLVYKIV